MVNKNSNKETLSPTTTPIKFCVFCGKKPEKKTKEHVIPQWLIKLTGNPNRKISLGIDVKSTLENKETKIREFSFSSFQFPACESCNEEFSNLENLTKGIILKVLARDYLNTQEINTLLNWFDKVRTGLWLGSIQLDRKFWQVDPNFHIKKRIAEKDRSLVVYEFDDDWQGIQFAGSNAPAFQYSPSCFSLTVNNFFFINTSSDFLFSRNIGFPYSKKSYYRKEDVLIESELTRGLEKIRTPLLKGINLLPSIEIYQPIIPTKMIEGLNGELNLWNNEYVKSNCLDFKSGLGRIFYGERANINIMKLDEEICLSDETLYHRESVMNKLIKQVFNQQGQFIKRLPSTENLTVESRRIIKGKQRDVLAMQKMFCDLLKISP